MCGGSALRLGSVLQGKARPFAPYFYLGVQVQEAVTWHLRGSMTHRASGSQYCSRSVDTVLRYVVAPQTSGPEETEGGGKWARSLPAAVRMPDSWISDLL